MRRYSLPVLLALLLGAVGFGLVQLGEVKKLQAALAGLDKERATLRQRIWELQKLNGDLASRLERGSPGPAAATAETGTAGGDGPAGNAQSGRARFDGNRFQAALNTPEMQKLMALQQKAGLDGRYAALFKQLNLSPADLEKFKSLLVEKQSALMDVMAAVRTEGLDPRTNRDDIRQLVQSAQTEVDNNIRTALGDAAFNQYKNYETTLPQRGVVDQLGQRLSYSSTPLTDTQSEQLVSLLAATSPASKSDGRAAVVAPFVQAITGGGRGGQFVTAMAGAGAGVSISDAAVTQAQGILTAPQLAALQSLQQEQQAAAQLSQQMRANYETRSRTNAGGTTTPPQPASPGGG